MNDVLKTLDGSIIDPKIPRYEKIIDELFFKVGEKYSNLTNYTSNGFISSGATIVNFSIVLPKSLKDIQTITVENLEAAFRPSDGGYFRTASSNYADTVFKKDDFSSIVMRKINDNVLRVDLVVSTTYKKSATVTATNNLPVSVVLTALTLNFS